MSGDERDAASAAAAVVMVMVAAAAATAVVENLHLQLGRKGDAGEEQTAQCHRVGVGVRGERVAPVPDAGAKRSRFAVDLLTHPPSPCTARSSPPRSRQRCARTR